MELSFEIVDRPEGVRPIPGETVQFTCIVRSSFILTWANSNFTNVSSTRAEATSSFTIAIFLIFFVRILLLSVVMILLEVKREILVQTLWLN